MTPVSILAVEDDPIQQASLELTLDEMGYHCAGLAESAPKAIEQFKRTSPDLVLLDIHLKGQTDGISLGHQLNTIRPTPLIFLTSFEDVETYNRARLTHPAAYLVKPVKVPALQSCIEHALRQFERPEEKIIAAPWKDDVLFQESLFVKIGQRLVRIKCEDILWAETAGNRYAKLVTAEREAHVRRSLTEIQGKLKNFPFVRIHRSFLINMNFLASIRESDQTVQIAGHDLPIGETYRKGFMQRINRL
ncbi:MAG: response regulator [Bacteroidota bacterium]